MRYLLPVALFSLILGCATSVKEILPPESELLPPDFQVETPQDRAGADYYLLKLAEGDKSRNTQWWVNYRRAHLWRDENPVLACEKFSDLAKDGLFPLKTLARLRAWESCPINSPFLVGIEEFRQTDFPDWLKPLALDVALARALRAGDKSEIMNLSLEKSKANLPQEKKLRFTETALNMARELGLKNEIRKLEERMYQIAPRLKPNPSPSEYLQVAYDFRRAREFNQSLDLYQKVLNAKSSSWEDKRAALDGIRLSHKNNRNNTAYLESCQALVNFLEKPFLKNKKNKPLARRYHEALSTLIRAQWTSGEKSLAQENIQKATRLLRKSYPLAEIHWIRGRMAEEERKYDEAINWVDEALKESPISAEFKEKLLWYKAWNLRKMGKKELAVESLVALKDLSLNEFARSRYTFWLGKTYGELKDKERARVEFQQLLEQDTLGYYGLLAHRELDEKIPASAVRRMVAAAETPKAKHLDEILDRPMTEWLTSVGETEIAQEYLDFIARSYKKRSDQDPETWLSLFKFYARAGSYVSLFEQLGSLPAERRNLILDAHPELLFPKPFYATVKNAAETQKVRLEMIYSIMRQESAFNPRARSPADAFGLMQVLPEVARVTAAQSQLSFARPDDLYNPQINIPIGAAHMKDLLAMYKGQFIPAVASYNAAHTAIKGWLRTRFQGDALEFIEDIPYEETRNYVRLVLRNLIFYSLIENAWKPIEFPEWTLDLKGHGEPKLPKGSTGA